MIASRWLCVVLGLGLAGCSVAVSATGLVSQRGPETWIEAPSGKARVLEGPEVARLRHLSGLVVSLDGHLRQGAIEVSGWTIHEGPLGFEAHVGRIEGSPGGPVLREARTGQLLGLHGDAAEPLWDQVGKWVLVEGIVDGPLRMRVMGSRPLEDAGR